MTPKEWAAKYGTLGKKVRDRRVLFFATTATMVDMSVRIWTDGKLSNGSKLTYKEDYEVYAYKPPSPRAVSGKGKTGKPIRGGWYPTYLSYKAGQGRADLPFELTGELRQSWAGGPKPKPVEKNPLLCLIEMPEPIALRAAGLAKQKGQFLLLSAGEKVTHAQNIEATYRELVLNRP